MGILSFPSPAAFGSAFAAGKVNGMIPLKLAGEMLGLSRARLLAIAGEGDDLVLVKIKMDDTTINGLTESSVRSLSAKRDKREQNLTAASEDAVRRHIVDSLLANGFASDSSKLLEYSAHVMQPFGLSHQVAKDRQHIGALLGTISEATLADPQCGALLSAVVINKTGPLKGKPSKSFWELVESATGQTFKKSDERDAYWRREISKVQKYIAALVDATPPATLAIPTSLVGSLDIRDETSTMVVKSMIYRGDSIGFDIETNYFGANQVVRAQGTAALNGGRFISTAIAPTQRGAKFQDLYRAVITISRIVELEGGDARVEGSWSIIKINGDEPFDDFEFSGELSPK